MVDPRVLHAFGTQLAEALDHATQGTTFARAVIVLWDPANPNSYVVQGNASDATHRAIVEAAYGPHLKAGPIGQHLEGLTGRNG